MRHRRAGTIYRQSKAATLRIASKRVIPSLHWKSAADSLASRLVTAHAKGAPLSHLLTHLLHRPRRYECEHLLDDKDACVRRAKVTAPHCVRRQP